MIEDSLRAVFALGFMKRGVVSPCWFPAAFDRLLFGTDTSCMELLFCARCSSDAKSSRTLFVIGY